MAMATSNKEERTAASVHLDAVVGPLGAAGRALPCRHRPTPVVAFRAMIQSPRHFSPSRPPGVVDRLPGPFPAARSRGQIRAVVLSPLDQGGPSPFSPFGKGGPGGVVGRFATAARLSRIARPI